MRPWQQERSGTPNRHLNWNRGDHEAVQRYLERTPKVLLDAQRAAFTKEGCTPAQKRLLKNWVTARVMDSSIEMTELLLAHLDAKRRK